VTASSQTFRFSPTSRGALAFLPILLGSIEALVHLHFFQQFLPETRGLMFATACLSVLPLAMLSETRLTIGRAGVMYAAHGFLGWRRTIPYEDISEVRVVVAQHREVLELELGNGEVVRVDSCGTVALRRLDFHNKAIAARSAVRESRAIFGHQHAGGDQSAR